MIKINILLCVLVINIVDDISHSILASFTRKLYLKLLKVRHILETILRHSIL